MKTLINSTLLISALLGFGLPALASENNPDPSLSQATREARLEGMIWTAYVLNPHLQQFDLRVRMEGERAELAGEVEAPVHRELAEHIAREMPGVATVDNRIVATGPGRAAGPSLAGREFAARLADLNLAAAVHTRLRLHELTSGLDLEVSSRNGVITLIGRSESPEHRTLAEQLARETRGVQAVDNRILARSP